MSAVDAQVLARLDAVLDELAGLDLDARSDDEVLSLWRGLEVRRNRLAPVDHAIIAQAQQRHLSDRYGVRSLTALARGALRVGVGEARARVTAAEVAGPRRALTGERLPARFEQVAAGQADGSVSPAAARAITETIERLPAGVPVEGRAWAEGFLVEQAGVFDLDSVRKLCVKVADTLDPDGELEDHEHRRRNREVTVTVRSDGSSRLRGDATAELTEHLLLLFDSLAAPRPETDGVKDDRSAGQRRHDALLDGLQRLERAGQLPDTGGLSATILLTMTADAYTDATTQATTEVTDSADATDATEVTHSRRGGPGYRLSGGRLARTGHGTLVPAREAIRWAGGDARIVPIVFDRARRVLAQGHAQRLFSESQRLAMAARDLGCSFPGCDAPPTWCQSHHVTDYAITRRTSIEDGTLLCGFHHREFERLGWHCVMTNGLPHWIPPWWVDPNAIQLACA
jgi:hypothetical protein